MSANTTGLRHHYGFQVRYNTIAGSGTGTTTTGTPTVLTKLARVKLPKFMRRSPDATELESPNGWREVLSAAGWKDSDEYGFTTLMQEGQFATLLGFFENGTEYYWEFWFPLISGETVNPKVLTRGIISSIDFNEISRDSDDLIMCPFGTKRTSDKPTWVAGS